MDASFPLHLIPLLPLLGAIINLLLGRRLGKGAVALVACGSVAAAALVATRAVWVLGTEGLPSGALVDRFFQADWIFSSGDGLDLHVSAGLMLDRLSAVMVLVVTWIGLLIHIYATGYMEHDPGYHRFFGYLNLFMGAMLILVLGDSLPVTFVGWEGVGVCSYLLIGFWYAEDKNATAGRKAFIVNRVGDFGFLLGMCLLFSLIGTLKYSEIGSHMQTLRQPLWLGWPAACFIALLIFVGCTGKSAQIPLHIWLPDAMAGPTPVSALIHAATMVTAGVYVVARTHVLFDVFPTSAKMVVAGIGAATALMAATVGIVQRDFKRILAYSTVSQLGFMFVGVGTGAYAAGIFHLMTHAFFKAGLFLGAGSVMHAMGGEGDITKMGGLGKHLPVTRWTFFIYCLAIAGIFPLAGFFSKDAILAGAWAARFQLARQGFGPFSVEWVQHFTQDIYPKLIWSLLAAAALCTAFYMWRLYFVVFTGRFRGTADQEHHLHESPPEMTVPLMVLAAGSVVAGWVGVPAVMYHEGDWFGAWLAPVLPPPAQELSHSVEWGLMAVALCLSVIGIASAYLLYYGGISEAARRAAQILRPLYLLLYNKYYIDELYDVVFVRPLKRTAWFLWYVVDAFFIDKVLVQGWAWMVSMLGRAVRYLQNGEVQRYLVGVLVGTAGILWVTTTLPPRRAAAFRLSQQGRRVTLEAGGGSSRVGLVYRVDWESDGKWDEVDTRWSTLTHEYPGQGTYKILFEARDPRWGTSSTRRRVVHIE
ncbi:MAG: NADH-quinone oxidoreductase subunit L [Myxococcales bacterium]|nr:NADH-quinone oxidoreductase subunit L [Myxococcota bacterium]MDW8282874.1 NADH-quinone oxidoreductase subunit L [Myxococcales bacterium]